VSREHEFALYCGDDPRGSGTAKELAEQMGVTPAYVRYLSSPAHQRRLARSIRPTGNAKYTVKLGPIEL
jgi:hypothetical protein